MTPLAVTEDRHCAIVKALANVAIRTTDELELNGAVRSLLDAAGIAYEAEVRLTERDRIDFLTDNAVGIELKTKGSTAALVRQLERYAQSERVDVLVVVTTLRRLTLLPMTVHGKMVTAICVGGL